MPFRKNSSKLSTESKVKCLNILNKNVNQKYIAIDGKAVKLNFNDMTTEVI